MQLILIIIPLTGFLSEAYYWFLSNFSVSYTRKILLEILDLLRQLWPYIIVGILITSLVKIYISRLFAIGVPLPALLALMVASPLIDPNLFLLTTSAMGIEMAIMRTASALLLGIAAGYTTRFILSRKQEWAKGLLRDSDAFSIEGLKFYTESVSVGVKDNLVEEGERQLIIYPNPAIDQVRIGAGNISETKATIKVYSMNGTLISILKEDELLAVNETVSWNLNDTRGNRVSPGIYICTIKSCQQVKSAQIIVN